MGLGEWAPHRRPDRAPFMVAIAVVMVCAGGSLPATAPGSELHATLATSSYEVRAGAALLTGPRADPGPFQRTDHPILTEPPPEKPVGFSKPIPPTVPITFLESGLSGGTNWSVVLDNGLESSTGVTVVFAIQNGTYDYTVQAVAGYSGPPVSGNLTVAGLPQTVSVTFKPTPGSTEGPSLVVWLGIGIATVAVILSTLVLTHRWNRKRAPPNSPVNTPSSPPELSTPRPPHYTELWNRPK
jgi:hypothetical protein